MRMRRIWNLVFALVVLSAGSFGASYLYRNYQELEVIRAKELAASRELQELRSKTKKRLDTIRKLEEDPEYIERVIRAKLKYARKDEVIFRFE